MTRKKKFYETTIAVSPLAALSGDLETAKRYREMCQWLEANTTGKWYIKGTEVIPTSVFFENKEDLLLYVITWR
jgi:hypothetical protein